MIIIRRFQPGDFSGVIDIENEQFSEHDPYMYMTLYELNEDTFFVADHHGVVVGFVVGIPSVDEQGMYGRVFSIAVREAYQGLGIGTQLMKSVIDVFHRKKIKNIVLEVRRRNIRAIRFYQRLGFVVTGIEIGYYSDYEDAIIMRHR
ncbi:MAG: ribosomal protein S18-alanine N-acetyltransferase [Methanosarcinales archaeon]|nr:ribosomal protein S18-alanine N-acetyltransferase [Methanosarcinales archaeon]